MAPYIVYKDLINLMNFKDFSLGYKKYFSENFPLFWNIFGPKSQIF